jgi:hypothetical protein
MHADRFFRAIAQTAGGAWLADKEADLVRWGIKFRPFLSGQIRTRSPFDINCPEVKPIEPGTDKE